MQYKFRRKGIILTLSAMLMLLPCIQEPKAQQPVSSSLGVIVYPAKGQAAEQQNKDEDECYAWAKQQTGIDPVATAQAPTEEKESKTGGRERLKGAAAGAAAGAAIGSLSGDMGEGAAIGAIGGTMLGGRKARKNKAAQEQQVQEAQASSLQHFNKAFGVCLEARGYTVR